MKVWYLVECMLIGKGEKDMTLGDILLVVCIPFVLITLYFGTKGGYYDSDNYNGDGCAHDVKR